MSSSLSSPFSPSPAPSPAPSLSLSPSPLSFWLPSSSCAICVAAGSNASAALLRRRVAAASRSVYSCPSSSTTASFGDVSPRGCPDWLPHLVVQRKSCLLTGSRSPCSPEDLQTVVEIEVSGQRPELALEDELPIVKVTPFEPRL